MDGALALDFLVEGSFSDAIHQVGIPEFLVERCLIVKACGKSEDDVRIELRHYTERDTWREERLLVEVPVGEPHAVVQRVERL